MFRHLSLTLLVLTGGLFCLSVSNSLRTAAVTPNSLSLNGSNAYVSVPNSTSLNITGPITVEAWIKTNSTSQQGIVERYGSGTNGGYALRLASGGTLQFFTLIGGNSFDYIQSTVAVGTGAWHHVAGVFDGSQLRVYIDGTQRGSKSSTFAPGTGTNTVKIGARGDDAAAKFNGLIDEVRITAGVVYTGGFVPAVDLTAITGTRGLWKFDGQTTSDSSGNNNVGTLQGSATYSTEVCDIPPTVSITVPANGAVFVVPVVTVSADASDSDGTIASVEFFQGSTSIGSDTSSPYSVTWSSVAAGNYSLTAKATDNRGATTTSSAVNITVNSSSGSITGKVTMIDGTTAIAAAAVKVYQGTTVVGTATTNTTGDYAVGSLGTGAYSVQASAAGYESTAQIAVSVSDGNATTLNVSLGVPITYLYDELGRLVSVIDKDGNAATYSYDAVGNLLAISRPGPAQIAIMQFNPVSGPVGASVTIYGAGFSATAAQNTVAFNGVSATVVSSSTNLIVTDVPAGATTGTIAVTSPAGSATSPASFSVSTGGAVGSPTITGFTPTVGLPGTAVTITGTNFDANPSNEKVALNITLTSPSSATSTSIATSVPSSAGSGRISVSTPYGKAVSSADFIVPPSPHTPANVESTARMTFGETKTITVTGSGKIGLVLFDGTVSQRVSIKVNTAGYLGILNVYNPDHSILVAQGGYIGGLFIEPERLFSTGTYTILNRTDYPPASITFTLYNVASDVTNTIAIAGTPVSVTTTTPGQNALVTFNGTAGQQISLNSSGSIPAWVLQILKPDGGILGSTNGAFIDNMTLPATGAYTILANPIDMHTGNATLTLYNVADVTGSLTISSPPVSTSITYPGQRSRLTFSGTAGQKVSLQGTNNSMSLCTLSIQNPDGTTLASVGGAISAAPFIDTKTLPATGNYTVVVDPQGTIVGSMSVRLYDVTDVTGTITPGGSPVTATITTPGQNAYITFSGTAGQRISFRQTGGSFGASILRPDGTTLASGTGYIDVKTLATTGTYTVKVDPSNNSTGSTTLTLYDVPPDVSGTVTIGGSSLPVTIAVPGQNGALTFAGTSGQVVTIHMAGNTVASVTLRLLKPDGTQLGTIWGGGNFNLANQTLPATGTYTIVIDPTNWEVGSLNINVTSP
ncbi:MAG: LamG-like jellyroll fold domain-containing protein [Acidobacteriota bacterium]